VTDPLQALLGAGAVPATSFPSSSRYAGVPVDTDPVPHLHRRFVPGPSRFSSLHEVAVSESDRRDLLAAAHLGDPELWWRLADANGIVDPRDLERPGRRVHVTLPEDVPGSPHA
jgi:hypothetical protein